MRAFLKFKAWILCRESGKYQNTFSEAPHYAAEELETHRAQAEEGERVSRGGSLGEKPTALQSGSALTESQRYLFICIPLLPLKSLKISVCRSQGLWACERGGSWEKPSQVWGEQRQTGPGVGVTHPCPSGRRMTQRGALRQDRKGAQVPNQTPGLLFLLLPKCNSQGTWSTCKYWRQKCSMKLGHLGK